MGIFLNWVLQSLSLEHTVFTWVSEEFPCLEKVLKWSACKKATRRAVSKQWQTRRELIFKKWRFHCCWLCLCICLLARRAAVTCATALLMCLEQDQSLGKASQTGEFVNHWLLLLLLSRFSRVQLCETPSTAAHQAPPSLGFSRQEHWSGLPFPSPMHEINGYKVKYV